MTSKLQRLIWLGCVSIACVGGALPEAGAQYPQDTPNFLMGFDGMVLQHRGLFRNSDPTTLPTDGYNTFQFGPFTLANPLTTGVAYGNELRYGRYTAFRFGKSGVGDCCFSHNARIHSDSPEHWNGVDAYAAAYPLDLSDAYFPTIDRAGYGQLFDPAQYQIEVKFKPLVQAAYPSGPTIPPSLANTATIFTVGLERHGGFIWDAEVGRYKRAMEQITYNIGTPLDENGMPVDPNLAINTWYQNAPKDANNYATWTVPVTQPAFANRSFYWGYAQNPDLLDDTLTNGGRVFNEDTQAWESVTTHYGPNSQNFGGGPANPNNPGSKMDTPNGTPLIYLGAPAATTGLAVEIKYVALTKINPGPIVARLDENSGMTFRFGSGFTYGPNQPPIVVPNDPFGLGYLPPATDQIARFDENGMYDHLRINMRTPDDANETHRLFVRNAPGPNRFNGEEVTVNMRARLLPTNTATSVTIVAKDLDGNDTAANPYGADEYTYTVDLTTGFNTSNYFTLSVPLSDFDLSMFTPPPVATPQGVNSTGPFGFLNPGDGEMTDFNLYEFGLLLPPNGGLLRMELDYLEIRLPDEVLAGDYNGDGLVDAGDYVRWRNHLGEANETNINNAGDGGGVTITDYSYWKARYGNPGAGGGGLVSSVPEPSTLVLLATVGWFVGLCGRRRSNVTRNR